jgi:hypothetical protein
MGKEEIEEQQELDEEGEGQGPPGTPIDDQMVKEEEEQQQGSTSLAVSQCRRSGLQDDSAYHTSGSRYLTQSTNQKHRLQNSEDEARLAWILILHKKWRNPMVEVVSFIDLTQEVDPEEV